MSNINFRTKQISPKKQQASFIRPRKRGQLFIKNKKQG
jgi:hypothetical protein